MRDDTVGPVFRLESSKVPDHTSYQFLLGAGHDFDAIVRPFEQAKDPVDVF